MSRFKFPKVELPNIGNPIKNVSSSVLKWHAKDNNDSGDYIKRYGVPFLITLVAYFAVIYNAALVDYEVIYAMLINSKYASENASSQAFHICLIMHLLLFVGTGIIAKNLVSDDYRTNQDDKIQLLIWSGIVTLLLVVSLFLSFNTDQSAKANAAEEMQKAEQQKKEREAEEASKGKETRAQLNNIFAASTESISGPHNELIAAETAKWDAKIKASKAYQAKLRRDYAKDGIEWKKAVAHNISTLSKMPKDKAYEPIPYLESKKANALAPLLAAKATALSDLTTAHNTRVSAASDTSFARVNAATLAGDKILEDLMGNIETAAFALKWRNIGLSVLGFLLMFALNFFYQGANRKSTSASQSNPSKDVLNQVKNAVANATQSVATQLQPSISQLQPQMQANVPIPNAVGGTDIHIMQPVFVGSEQDVDQVATDLVKKTSSMQIPYGGDKVVATAIIDKDTLVAARKHYVKNLRAWIGKPDTLPSKNGNIEKWEAKIERVDQQIAALCIE